MGLLFALTLPGLVCLLVLIAAVERFGVVRSQPAPRTADRAAGDV